MDSSITIPRPRRTVF